MAKHKQDLFDKLISGLSLRGILFHSTTLFLLATFLLIGTAIFLWEGHQEKIINPDEFRLTAEKIQLPSPPEWTETNLKQLVIAESDYENASILDTQLVPRTAGIMKRVGFVDQINRIQKTKSGLDIDVDYRKPVAFVELSRVTLGDKWPAANRGKTVLLPVDRHGVLMPEAIGKDLTLPWIAVVYPANFTELETWKSWPDERIQQAAQISSLFPQPLAQLGVQRIKTIRYRQSKTDQASIPYELLSGSGTRIIWGNAPGNELEGEASPEEKILAIAAVVQKYGTLDKFNLGRIDVRTGKAMAVTSEKTANSDDGFFAELK